MISKGYVGLFSRAINQEVVGEFVVSWVERFEKLEQVVPSQGNMNSALTVTKPEEIMWEPNLQFRVLNGQDFSWIYLTLDRRVVETSGLPVDGVTLTLDVLLELPGLIEIIDEHNDKRLDELEAGGLM